MQDDIKTWLLDIQQAITEINDFLPDKKDFFQFKRDLKTKRAIERNVGIIGEAANRILKLNPDIAITDIQKSSPHVIASFMAMIMFQTRSFGRLW